MLTAVISDEWLSPGTTQLVSFQLSQTLCHLWLSINSTFPEHCGHGDDWVPSGVSVSQRIHREMVSSFYAGDRAKPGKGEVIPGVICWILGHGALTSLLPTVCLETETK